MPQAVINIDVNRVNNNEQSIFPFEFALNNDRTSSSTPRPGCSQQPTMAATAFIQATQPSQTSIGTQTNDEEMTIEPSNQDGDQLFENNTALEGTFLPKEKSLLIKRTRMISGSEISSCLRGYHWFPHTDEFVQTEMTPPTQMEPKTQILVYTEYAAKEMFMEDNIAPQQWNIADVMRVFVDKKSQWWKDTKLLTHVITASGKRLRLNFPLNCLTSANLRCQLTCTGLIYRTANDAFNKIQLYRIMAESLSDNKADRPKPLHSYDNFHLRSEIKITWILHYDNPTCISPRIHTHEDILVHKAKEISGNFKENSLSKTARILAAFSDFCKDRQKAQKEREEYFYKEYTADDWDTSDVLNLKFDNLYQLRNACKNPQSKRKSPKEPKKAETPQPPAKDAPETATAATTATKATKREQPPLGTLDENLSYTDLVRASIEEDNRIQISITKSLNNINLYKGQAYEDEFSKTLCAKLQDEKIKEEQTRVHIKRTAAQKNRQDLLDGMKYRLRYASLLNEHFQQILAELHEQTAAEKLAAEKRKEAESEDLRRKLDRIKKAQEYQEVQYKKPRRNNTSHVTVQHNSVPAAVQVHPLPKTQPPEKPKRKNTSLVIQPTTADAPPLPPSSPCSEIDVETVAYIDLEDDLINNSLRKSRGRNKIRKRKNKKKLLAKQMWQMARDSFSRTPTTSRDTSVSATTLPSPLLPIPSIASYPINPYSIQGKYSKTVSKVSNKYLGAYSTVSRYSLSR